jgi:hypothetical protein
MHIKEFIRLCHPGLQAHRRQAKGITTQKFLSARRSNAGLPKPKPDEIGLGSNGSVPTAANRWIRLWQPDFIRLGGSNIDGGSHSDRLSAGGHGSGSWFWW